MTVEVDGTCFCSTEAWLVLVGSVTEVGGRKGLSVSTAPAGGW